MTQYYAAHFRRSPQILRCLNRFVRIEDPASVSNLVWAQPRRVIHIEYAVGETVANTIELAIA
jgi:hypothetical protein